MQWNYLAAMTILFIAAVSLGIVSYKYSRGVLFGKETKARNLLLISAGMGFSSSLFLFSGVYLLAVITGKSALASLNTLFQSFLLFLIPGLTIFLGSLSQFYQVRKVQNHEVRKH